MLKKNLTLILILFIIYLPFVLDNSSHTSVENIDWNRGWRLFEFLEFNFYEEKILIAHRDDLNWYGEAVGRFFGENKELLRSSREEDDIKISVKFTYTNSTLRWKL